MSSTFSMANQKLKQFFGATQTKDFNLQAQKDNYEEGSNKLNLFITALKKYEEILLEIPKALERLYVSFEELSPKHMYYDGVEYRSNYFQIIEVAKLKANNLNERYSYLQRQLSIEEEHIKKQQKEFDVIRQRYDHYKTKVQKLTKQFSSMENPKAHKQGKEQLDRNFMKLTDSQIQYTKQLMRMRTKLQTYHRHFADMAFGCYQIFSEDLCEFLMESAENAKNIKEFVQSQKIRGKENTMMAKPIPIETLFEKKRIDFFPEMENKFLTSNPSNIKSFASSGDEADKSTSRKSNVSKSSFDQFNFFMKEGETPKEDKIGQTTKPNQNIDLLGIF